MKQIFKLFAKKLIPVKFTCWYEHKENNLCSIEFKGRILKKVYLNLSYEILSLSSQICIRYVHDIIFCPYCKRLNKITWIERDDIDG